MKKIMIGGLLAALAIGARAQDVTGTMLEQLAALKGYIITAEKGYRIAEEGIHTIRDIRRGEFGLHSVFFGSLALVTPPVKGMPGVAETIDAEGAMLRGLSDALARWRSSGLLSAGELDYAGGIDEKLRETGLEDVHALGAILKDGALEMEDGERMRQVEVLLRGIRERNRWLADLIAGGDLLIARRRVEAGNIDAVKKLIGLH
jgi:hypothetical protein